MASKKLLDATVLRQEAIASNLANLETPNYKRLDLAPSFHTELQQAVQAGNSGQVTAVKPHLAADSTAPAGSDGNTVQLESELANLQQNQMEHSLGTQLVTGTLLRLRLAITGRAS